ncbi:hypothetical protein GCM10022223_43260 [Kineosporia mesophila]|uniref:Uncharacterized protein n=1 Tax=Kineosporia mesophila TaxID=566012 RepID=A0ABP7A029_9ACTN|nr:hypothetical protein [Kineosporia mesophila]MCD5353240.1 hypothetical protein [Kineosporia mesophila]
MRDQVLQQFTEDAGAAFVEVIRKADRPVSKGDITAGIVDAGADSAQVQRQWERLRGHLKAHPNISKPKPTLYEWSFAPRPSRDSLYLLAEQAGKRGQAWLVQAYVDALADTLARAETTSSGAHGSWSDQRELEKVTLIADLVSSVAMLAAEGRSTTDIEDWLLQEADRHRLSPIGRIGEEITYDKDLHEPKGGRPRAGDLMRVTRPGFSWIGTGHPVTVVKALVEHR